MSKQPNFSAELHQLCGKLREGELTKLDADRLNAMLRESKAARRFYRTFMALTSALETRDSLQDAVDTGSDSDKNIEALFELLQREQQAPAIPFPQTALGSEPAPVQPKPDAVGWHELTGATAYLLNTAARSSHVRWLAAAAVVLLGITIAIVLSLGSNDAPSEIAESPDSDSPIVAPLPIVDTLVATLTAEHDAAWDRRPGQDLYEGQRFMLTKGFAEITTKRGAIAILEAPATIELIHNDNAIQLHSGKLVGICETESSKGFLVRTPHMDITDIGTRFGVDATEPGTTSVQVFEGQVEAALIKPADEQPERRRLTSGQALAADTERGWLPAAYEPNRYAIAPGLDRYRPDFAGTSAAWLGKVAGDLGQDKQRADTLQVFLERAALPLAEPVAVDVLGPGTWDVKAQPVLLETDADQRVDVYLLHFDLINAHKEQESFVIDFGRPILGVIATHPGLDNTDATLGVDGVNYPVYSAQQASRFGGPRGLNVGSGGIASQTDAASVDPNGTTLRLRLWGGGEMASMDQVRVIVQAAEDQP